MINSKKYCRLEKNNKGALTLVFLCEKNGRKKEKEKCVQKEENNENNLPIIFNIKLLQCIILEKESVKKRKPCIVFIGDIEKITNKFLKKGFTQEKHFLRGAVRSFTYSLGYKMRLHVRIFEQEGKYACYGHTEPKPLSDPLFHIKGAIAGSVPTQKALNIVFGVSKIASDILDKVKPKKEDEELTQEEQRAKENIETFQKISNSVQYFPEEKSELADYEEGCRVLRDLFSEYVKK